MLRDMQLSPICLTMLSNVTNWHRGSNANDKVEALNLIDSADQDQALAIASRLRTSTGLDTALASELIGLVALQRGRLAEARASFFEAAEGYSRKGLSADCSRILGCLADIAGVLSKLAERSDNDTWTPELAHWGQWSRIKDLPAETPESGFNTFMRQWSASPTRRFTLAQRDLIHESLALAERSADVEAIVSARMRASADLMQTLEIATREARPDLEVTVLVRLVGGAIRRPPSSFHGGSVAPADYSEAHRLCKRAHSAAARAPERYLVEVLVAEAELARTQSNDAELSADMREQQSQDAERALREAAGISHKLGLVQREYDCLSTLSRFLRIDRGDERAAATLSGRILELARKTNNPDTISSALELSRLAAELGNSDDAGSLAAERVRLAREQGQDLEEQALDLEEQDQEFEQQFDTTAKDELAKVLATEAKHASSRGDLTSARAWIEEAVELRRAFDSAGDLSYTLVDAGFIAIAALEPEVALRHLEEAIAIQRAYTLEYSFSTYGLESCLRSGATGAALLGRFDIAVARMEELLQVVERGSSPSDRDRAELLCSIGICAAIGGNPDYGRLRLIDSVRLLDKVMHATDYHRPVISPRGSPLGNRWDRENIERLSASIKGLAGCAAGLGSSAEALALDGMAESIMDGAPPPPSTDEVERDDPFAGLTKLLDRLQDKVSEPLAAPWVSVMSDHFDQRLGDRATRERSPEYQSGRKLSLEAILARIART